LQPLSLRPHLLRQSVGRCVERRGGRHPQNRSPHRADHGRMGCAGHPIQRPGVSLAALESRSGCTSSWAVTSIVAHLLRLSVHDNCTTAATGACCSGIFFPTHRRGDTTSGCDVILLIPIASFGGNGGDKGHPHLRPERHGGRAESAGWLAFSSAASVGIQEIHPHRKEKGPTRFCDGLKEWGRLMVRGEIYQLGSFKLSPVSNQRISKIPMASVARKTSDTNVNTRARLLHRCTMDGFQ
jgi:hypothetical protein